MTNLLASIVVAVVTNWSDVSVEYPVSQNQNAQYGGVNFTTLVYQPLKVNQRGEVMRKTYADLEWQGRIIRVELESERIGTESRSYNR